MKRCSAMYIDQYFDKDDEKTIDWPIQATLYLNDRIAIIAYFWESDNFSEFRNNVIPFWAESPNSIISIESAKFDNESSL